MNLWPFKKKNVNFIPGSQTGIEFFTYQNRTVWEACNDASIKKWMQGCAPLAYIIQRKAAAFLSGNFEVLNPNTGNYVRGQYKEWERLLDQPNPLQTRTQFFTQLYIYVQVYGYCPVLVGRPAGFGFDRITSLWILPPDYCEIKTNDRYLFTESFMDQIDSITFKVGRTETRIDREDVFLFTDISTNLGSLIFPDSRLTPLSRNIQNIIYNLESRGTIAEKRGAIGILSNTSAGALDKVPLKASDKEQLQEDYLRYGMGREQWQLIITNANLQYQPITMPVRDMMLLETEQADVRTIADALGYPSELLGNDKGVTFANKEEAKKMLYQDVIIPESIHIAAQFNKAIHAEDNKVRVNIDYSHLPILQADEKMKAETRKAKGEAAIQEYNNGLITFNEARALIDMDTVSDGDKYKQNETNTN